MDRLQSSLKPVVSSDCLPGCLNWHLAWVDSVMWKSRWEKQNSTDLGDKDYVSSFSRQPLHPGIPTTMAQSMECSTQSCCKSKCIHRPLASAEMCGTKLSLLVTPRPKLRIRWMSTVVEWQGMTGMKQFVSPGYSPATILILSITVLS